jgi:hypothetical protein
MDAGLLSGIGLTGIGFSPLVAWEAIAALGVIAFLLLLFGIFRGARGSLMRMTALGLLVLALFNPHLESENRTSQPDIAIIAIDESSSQNTGERRAQLKAALKQVQDKLAEHKNLQVRVVRGQETDDGTEVFGELNRALADLPKGRFAGAVVISDGQIHDAPKVADQKFDRPLHLLLTGKPNERDRRLIVERAPAYGIVGKEVKVRVRVEDNPKRSGGASGTAVLTLKIDGKKIITTTVPIGQSKTITVPVDHGGATIIEMDVQKMVRELSLANNRAVITVNGVRDRLRVLLVSGQPHLGERTWRNLLKSDPSVDLVHFTILRPPEKNDFTPLNELALISFPIRELFEVKLHEFDLIVFDRYVIRFVLPPNYFQNIEQYVQKGGAVLAAVGPDFAGVRSLYHTPLGKILPGEPSGPVIEGGFKAKLTDKGHRHPVTGGLPGSLTPGQTGEASWGRWFRQIDAVPRKGHTLMSGAEDKPLLILDRVGEGRVAQFMSDQIWLWARGHDGGGPHAELLRRLSHWLMKEPDLEEEDLRAKVDGRELTIERRSLEPALPPITLTAPSGKKTVLKLLEDKTGAATLTVTAEETGLYKIEDGRRSTLAAIGKLNPAELSDLRASPDKVGPLVKASGGGVAWISEGVPDIRRTKLGRSGAGNGWFGLVSNGAYTVTGVRQVPLFPALLFLFFVAGGVMLSWWREGQ